MDWDNITSILILSGEYVGAQRYVDRLRPYLIFNPTTRYGKGAKKFVEGWDEMKTARELDTIDRQLQEHFECIGKLLVEKTKYLPTKEKVPLII